MDGEVINSSEEFYKSFPGLKKLIGGKGVSNIQVDDGIVTFLGPQKQQADAEGNITKVSQALPYILDTTQDYDTILQQIANIVKESGYKQINSRKELPQ